VLHVSVVNSLGASFFPLFSKTSLESESIFLDRKNVFLSRSLLQMDIKNPRVFKEVNFLMATIA
jgi:hypothetical protein